MLNFQAACLFLSTLFCAIIIIVIIDTVIIIIIIIVFVLSNV